MGMVVEEEGVVVVAADMAEEVEVGVDIAHQTLMGEMREGNPVADEGRA